MQQKQATSANWPPHAAMGSHHHHHYDYYTTTTDSELTLSQAQARPQPQQHQHQHKPRQQFYDHNLLLFATEHSNAATQQQQQRALAAAAAGKTLECGPQNNSNNTNTKQHQAVQATTTTSQPQRVRLDSEAARGPARDAPGLGRRLNLAANGATPTIPRSESEQSSHFNAANSASQPRRSRSSYRRSPYARQQQQVGRFVQCYPASRQPTPTRRHASPYSFHVPTAASYGGSGTSGGRPLARSPSPAASASVSVSASSRHQYQQLQLANSSSANLLLVQVPPNGGHHQNDGRQGAGRRPVVPACQARYGYVTPVDRLEQRQHQRRRPLSAGSRSRTLASIPSLVHVSVTGAKEAPRAPPPPPRSAASPYDELYDDDDQEGAFCDDFGAHDQADDYEDEHHHQHHQHGGQLLRAHRVCVRGPLAGEPTLGQDNPFRPGTELSWEADMMVRLMRRGYPVQELPALVRAAREAHESSQRSAARRGASGRHSKSCDRLPTAAAQASHGSNDHGPKRQLPPPVGPAGGRDQSGRPPPPPPLSTSGLDLSQACRRTWASSLSRAKSAPRIYGAQQQQQQQQGSYATRAAPQPDTDSLDRLITSIELELASQLEEVELAKTDDWTTRRTDQRGKQSRSKTMQDFGRVLGEPEAAGAAHPELQERLQERVEQIKQQAALGREPKPPRGARGKPPRSASGRAGSVPDLQQQQQQPQIGKHQAPPSDLTNYETNSNNNTKLRLKKANKCCMIQ